MQYPALIRRQPRVITVSVAQGGTGTPDATKQLLPTGMVFKRIIYASSTKSRDYIGRSSSFLVAASDFSFNLKKKNI